ncbi:MAG: serine/threonine-protein kinase, partial [Myxococcota bacterium]
MTTAQLSAEDEVLLSQLPERYQVRTRLGQGGMATVFRAWDSETQTDVALKVLHSHLRSDLLVKERFRREVAAARRINSPHVVTIYELIASPLALVMDYVPGVDLKRLIRRRGALSVAEVLTIGDQMLQGLSAAHRAGILHRDIKPHNILVEEGEALRVRLTDFGLARVDDLIGVTTHTMTLGTPEYMPPELLDGTLVDGRADLYSLGVTLYEALTGKLPFVATSPMALLRMHDTQQPPDPRERVEEVPEPLALAIMQAMAKDPDDRFATAEQMREALQERRLVAAPPLPTAEPCPSCGAPIPAGL